MKIIYLNHIQNLKLSFKKMDYFDKNSPKMTKFHDYSINNKFNLSMKYNNNYKFVNSQYLIPDSKKNIKSSSKSNNFIFHDIANKNTEYQIKENPKMIKYLKEYYSNPFQNLKYKNTYKNKNSNINNDNLLARKQYLLNQNPKNKYLDYSPHKRYTFNYKEKIDTVPNIVSPISPQVNSYQNQNKYLLNPNRRINKVNNINTRNERGLLLNKLNNSKSTHNFYGEDILIEYNNVPIIDKKEKFNKRHLKNYSNNNNDYLNKNSPLSDFNSFSYENINNSSYIENNNNIKNIIYVNNNFNKTHDEKDFLRKNYFDVNISNIEENYDFVNEKENILKEQKWKFSRHKNFSNIPGNIINNNFYNNKDDDYFIKDSFENYQSNNNIFDINDNNYNMNIYESQSNKNKYKSKKPNNSILKNKEQINKNINNYKIININKSIYLNNNNIENEKNNNNEQKLKNFKNKSKKDLLKNKELKNIIDLGNPKFKNKNRNSPELKNKIYPYYNISNINNQKTTKNYLNNKNISYHEIFDIKSINNKRNNNIQNNLYKSNLLTEKNINNKKLHEYIIKDNKDISYINYETSGNITNNQNKINNNLSYIKNFQNKKNNCNYLEIKNNTSRINNSKLEARNLILNSENSPIINNNFSQNIYPYKSSGNIKISKKCNKINNQISQKKKINISPIPSVRELNTEKNNNINIILDENNKRESSDNLNSKTESNIKSIIKKEKNKMNFINKKKILNANSFNILKNINMNNINNLPIKLYLKKQMKNQKDIIKPNNNEKENNNNNMNTNKNKIIRQVKSTFKCNSIINNNIINSKNDNNIININNISENKNLLTDEKNQINIIYPNKNKKISNLYDKGNNKFIKNNNKAYIKTITNELFDKNKNFKNVKFISPMNRNINKSNSIMTNYPSYIQTSTFDLKYNKGLNLQTENNSKSNKNILYKGIFSENNRKIKQMILNNSSHFLLKDEKLIIDNTVRNTHNKNNSECFRDIPIQEKNNLNNNEKNKKEKIIKNNHTYKISQNNININKLVRTPNLENNLNLINFNEKIKIPIIPNLTQINSQKLNVNKNKTNVYIKPFGLSSKSKSKPKKSKRSKSVIKIFPAYNSERNASEKNIFKRNKSNFDYYFKTSPLFFLKDDYFQSENGSIKRGSTSLNTSHRSKNENSSFKTKENEFSFINNSTIINFVREPFKKEYFFAHKIYNYFLKIPMIEQCFYNKKIIYKKNEIELLSEDNNKNNINNSNINLKYFENNNNDKQLFFEQNKEINNIENYNYNDIEESGLDIYKELHKKMENNQEEKSNDEKLNLMNKEDLINETIQKLKNLSKDYEKINSNLSLEEENNNSKKNEMNEENSKFANLQNGFLILDHFATKRGLKSNEENSMGYSKQDKREKSKEKISLGTNKLNDLFNNRKNNDLKNIDNEEFNNINYLGKSKCSKSLNKDIIKGISKIENVFEKNNISTIKINDSKEENKLFKKENYFEYNEEQKQKIRTYAPSKSNKFNIITDKNDINSNVEEIKLNEYRTEIEVEPKYKERELFFNNNLNNQNNDLSKNNYKEIKINNYFEIEQKNNEVSNNYKESISFSDEENIKLSKSNSENNEVSFEANKNNISNNSNNSEEFDNYLNIRKENKSKSIINQDLTFLLNIISRGNYNFCLKQITQIILYNFNKTKDKETAINKTLKENNDIIYNENSFMNIIFKQISKGTKYIFLFCKLCADLNKNISNDLSEQKNMKNNKKRNLKLIVNEKCIKFLNELKEEENKIEKDKIITKSDDLRNKIFGFVIFVIGAIKVEIIKQQFGFYVLEQLYKLINTENIDEIHNIFLEGIILLANKLGTIVYEKDNKKILQNINTFIDNNLLVLIDAENKIRNISIPIYLRYRILNLLTKKENQWKNTLFDIFEEEEKMEIIPEYKSNLFNNILLEDEISKINKPKKQKSLQDINKALIEEDIINYISYFSEENNKGKINIKSYVDKSYNWKVIDELVNNKNFGLESIINYFISICSTLDYDDNKIILCNDYIKNIIEFYVNNLSKKAIESLQNEMIKTFSNIDDILETNKNMYKILGNLLLVLIDNKLFLIKFFNHYLKLDKKTQINLAIITKYCIISSGKFTKKYLNDFKQTKLFNNNDIFEKYVVENMEDLLYFIK